MAARARLPALGAALALVVALAVAYGRTIAPSVTWANGGGDGGDLVAAAATFGVAHPTGYPTYLLLARSFLLLPFGELAFRVALLSAASAICAALCVFALVLRICAHTTAAAEAQGHTESTIQTPLRLRASAVRTNSGTRRNISDVLAAAFAALALGLSPLFWSQAVIAEVYALNALFLALILLWTLDATRGAPLTPWSSRLRPLAMGLMLGNHVTIALPIAAWCLASIMATPRGERMRWLVPTLAWLAAGMLVYAYLPLAARGNPPINWGDPRTLRGFWFVVSGQLYRDLPFGLPLERAGERVSAAAGLLATQFGWAGLALALGGLVYAPRGQRRFAALTAVVALGYAIFAISYNSDDSDAYLLPAFVIFAVWLGWGAGSALHWLGARSRLAPLVLLPLAALLFWNAPTTLNEVDASKDRGATDYAAAVLRDAPTGALVVTTGDRDTFPLWYFHYALGQRRDLRLVVDPLLGFSWYRATLRATYALPFPDDADALEALVSQNPTFGPLCRTDTERTPPLTCKGN